ncbi:putative E3 ubiquitin-protein ligase [Paratrimastix pyriformis]|uniref:E3 ubiquitin-protein ligase n=1 Tax=Paratrimastix pyriformis TaxID=342808 RepID=A0ABQ8UG96_9EUKA|nr:putative E3 ubiquitin-protein ligase [Paratrimastix pyriformis]
MEDIFEDRPLLELMHEKLGVPVSERKFRAHFGLPSMVTRVLIEDYDQKPLQTLKSLNWLKTYPRNIVFGTLWRCDGNYAVSQVESWLLDLRNKWHELDDAIERRLDIIFPDPIFLGAHALDGTECRVRRPSRDQEVWYSGKKGCHTIKYEGACTSVRGGIATTVLEPAEKAVADLGYVGIDWCITPIKRRPGEDLDHYDRLYNKRLGIGRSTIEHALFTFRNESRKFDEFQWALLTELGPAEELIRFVREAPDADFRMLAQLEIDDANITAENVRALCHVAAFLREIFEQLHAGSLAPKPFLGVMSQFLARYRREDLGTIAQWLHSCSAQIAGLRRLYLNRGRHGEGALSVITAASSSGIVDFQLLPATPSALLEVSEDSTHWCKALLHCHGSEADRRELCCVTAVDLEEAPPAGDDGRPDQPKSNVLTRDRVGQIRNFIEVVDRIQGIVDGVAELHHLGHFQFRHFQRTGVSPHELESLAQECKEALVQWRQVLAQARAQHFFLRFFYSDQFFLLHDFFLGPESLDPDVLRAAFDALRFVNPNLPSDQLPVLRCSSRGLNLPPSVETPPCRRDLHLIGLALDRVFKQFGRAPVVPLLASPEMMEFMGDVRLDTIIPGRPTVLVPAHGKLVNVIMGLFLGVEQTTSPTQLLLCNSETPWEEIVTFLDRAFGDPQSERLYVLAGIEDINFECQLALVEELRCHQTSPEGPQTAIRLALLCAECKQERENHFLNQATAKTSTVGLPDALLKLLFSRDHPNVAVFTSEVSGLGKTEELYTVANWFHASGAFACVLPARFTSTFVQCRTPSCSTQCSFELLVLGLVSSERHFFYRPAMPIYLEVATTPGHMLVDQLPMLSYLEGTHLVFDLERLVVSRELLSPVQVVCNFLSARERNMLGQADVCFPDKNVQVLDQAECRRLLKTPYPHFPRTFSVLRVFLNVFSNQLLHYSRSAFFMLENLRVQCDSAAAIPNTMVGILFEEALRFAVVSSQTRQQQALSQEGHPQDLLEVMASRTKSMVRWEESNQCMIVFHKINDQSLSAIYREVDKVPADIRSLLRSVHPRDPNWQPEDYQDPSFVPKLRELLVRMCRRVKTPFDDDPTYAVTPDNMLKMVMIALRVDARCPVIIMGETGCGKTSLIRYLSRLVGVELRVLNVHAGTTLATVRTFLDDVQTLIRTTGQPCWVFIDECNTAELLGHFNDIVCHHSFEGSQLDDRLVVLAACNPYRLRTAAPLKVGLEAPEKPQDPLSRLVYRVHPLPDSMLDWVWDYGTLDSRDELRYLGVLLEGLPNRDLLVNLVAASQQFIRDHFEDSSVSLRDVRRFRILTEWFRANNITSRPARRGQKAQSAKPEEIERRSIVLALAHCYHSRLPTNPLRQLYREKMARLFNEAGVAKMNPNRFAEIVREEQEDYLQRMTAPAHTAHNSALLENVFMVLVCILNRIPIFMVGKPGCSKSLSLRLIAASLMGESSSDPWFRLLPAVYVISYQGSSVSTSEEIIQVFEKARRYIDKEVIPVVLLDEVGLAEISSFNPLKVLHSLLEPDQSGRAEVAVVGISNWVLDEAKMARAIHLCRPDPDEEDLLQTAASIVGERSKNPRLRAQMEALARGYYQYIPLQEHTNFHGLRDFYSLIKSLGVTLSVKRAGLETSDIFGAIERNFGGVRSQFEKDKSSPEYHYRILNRILLAMETGCCLILIGLDDIYASLYEMLNQSYTIRGNRRTCQVALGSLANRVADVHPRFKCIVLIDQKELDQQRPPFLNRFEKQEFTFADALSDQQRDLVTELRRWALDVCTLQDGFVSAPPQSEAVGDLEASGVTSVPADELSLQSAFLGMTTDSLRALVSAHAGGEARFQIERREDIMHSCQENLLHAMSADGVVRILRSRFGTAHPDQARALYNTYFSCPVHSNLRSCVEFLLTQPAAQPQAGGFRAA